MRRKIGCALLLLCCLVLVAGVVVYRLYGFRTNLTRTGSGIAVHPPPYGGVRGKMESLPRFDPESLNSAQVELQGWDLRGLDLSGRLADLSQASFDNHTQWPAELPAAFDPTRAMEMGKNPGLGMRALHEKGITGQGVSVAIIDHRLVVDHVEYKDRLRLYEELHSVGPKASMHGTAVASIAVGKTVGVAPEADLYYISSYFMKPSMLIYGDWRGVDFTWTAKSVERLLEINRNLPDERKIRVISIEIGWRPGRNGYDEVTAAVEEAKAEGVLAVSSSLRETHGLRFHGLGRGPLNDPEDPASYHLITAWGQGFAEPTLLIPMDSRTTAAPTGEGDYVFYRQGGWSWVTPYLAGLYALACQVKPDITPELFWEKAIETGTTPDYDAVRPVSREALREKMAARFDAKLSQAKGPRQADHVKRQLMTRYSEANGEPAPAVGEAEFRDWAIERMTDEPIRLRAGREARIVNPVALMEALQE